LSYGVFIFLWEFLIPLFIYVIAYWRMLVPYDGRLRRCLPIVRILAQNCYNGRSGPYTTDDWME